MHTLVPLLRSVPVCELANVPVADVAAAVGVPNDENEMADDEVKMEADVVEGVDVVVDVDEDEIEADVIGDVGVAAGVGVDENVMISAVDVDHVIAERLDLRLFSRSEYSP